MPRTPNRANWCWGIIPPHQVTACPVRDCFQPVLASASASEKSRGIPIVTSLGAARRVEHHAIAGA